MKGSGALHFNNPHSLHGLIVTLLLGSLLILLDRWLWLGAGILSGFLVVAIVVVVIIGHGFWPLVLTLGFLAWPIFQRVVYAEASSIFQRDYVKAARIAGVGRITIMFQHVLPGVRASLMVIFAFHFAGLLIAESALSFLGIGAPLGVPTWGNILAESRQYMLKAPWMMLVPGGAIVVTVVTMNLVGDGIAGLARRRGRSIDA